VLTVSALRWGIFFWGGGRLFENKNGETGVLAPQNALESPTHNTTPTTQPLPTSKQAEARHAQADDAAHDGPRVDADAQRHRRAVVRHRHAARRLEDGGGVAKGVVRVQRVDLALQQRLEALAVGHDEAAAGVVAVADGLDLVLFVLFVMMCDVCCVMMMVMERRGVGGVWCERRGGLLRERGC
jgi:hypothetical protein